MKPNSGRHTWCELKALMKGPVVTNHSFFRDAVAWIFLLRFCDTSCQRTIFWVSEELQQLHWINEHTAPASPGVYIYYWEPHSFSSSPTLDQYTLNFLLLFFPLIIEIWSQQWSRHLGWPGCTPWWMKPRCHHGQQWVTSSLSLYLKCMVVQWTLYHE